MLELDAEFWVAVAFVVFLGVLAYLGVHETLVKLVDQRRDRIKAELDEARRLKEEAQALLAQYQRRQREAEQEAAAIIAGASAEAERMLAEAKTKMEEFVARRSSMAETKIAQAEPRRWPTCAPPRPKPPSARPSGFSRRWSRARSPTASSSRASTT